MTTGRSHCLALDYKGRVWSWGTNDKGQLGHAFDDSSMQDTPKRVMSLRNIVQIYCGEYQSFAVDNNGNIFAWGLNKNNCLLLGVDGTDYKTIEPEP